jgi:carboxypeptidase family protein
MKRFTRALTLITILLGVSSGEATAQSCPLLRSQSEAYARAAAVFIGKVKQKGNMFAMTRRGPISVCEVTYIVTFAVEKSYFEAREPEYTIYSDYPTDNLKEGETYLVYAFKQDGMLSTFYDYREVVNGLTDISTCSRTRLLSDAEGDLPFLEDPATRIAGVTIYGTVARKRKATPLNGVKLQVTGNGRTYTAVTDGEGKYRITGLSAGDYKVKIKLPWTLRTRNANRLVSLADRGSIDESFVVKPRFGW